MAKTPLDARQAPGLWEPWMDELLAPLQLEHGSHTSFLAGVCLMEAISYITGQDRTDHPVCVSPAYRSTGMTLNDRAPSPELRNKLKPLIPNLMQTRPLKRDGTPKKGRPYLRKEAKRARLLKERVSPLLNGLSSGPQAAREKQWKKALAEYAAVIKEVG